MSKATILPIYHHPIVPISTYHHNKSTNENSLTEICDHLLRINKFKLLGITFGVFLCSLWIVVNCNNGNGGGFYLRYYNKNSRAAFAAASVLGEGGEEGIHGLEVENHDRNSPNGHNHGIHEPLNLKHFMKISPSPQNKPHFHFNPEHLHQPNYAQKLFGEALKHDMDLEDYGYIEAITGLEMEINDLIQENPIVIFSKSYCPYSQKAKQILSQYNIIPNPIIIEVDRRDDADEIKQVLIKFTYQSTFPNIFVNGISIGGSEELSIMNTSGKLKELLVEAGVLEDSSYDNAHPAL